MNRNIFVINSGSSSIKYQLIRMPEADTVCTGLIERIGTDASAIIHKRYINGQEIITTKKMVLKDHAAGLKEAADLLTDPTIGVIKSPEDIHAIGHRVVHGGETFSDTMFVTEDVKEKIKTLFPLAPLHNPANHLGIEVAERIFPQAKQIAVFDTAFGRTIPEVAFRYAIPNELYTKYHIRAYGFHGTSHKYVSSKAIEWLHQANNSRIITIHLGNGCSMCAVLNAKCIDTSLGLGPMNGLIMGTRAGDIDQSVIFYLVSQGYTLEKVNQLLNKESGMLGLTGHSDMRDIRALMDQGSEEARLAYDMYAYRIRKYIGAYSAALNGLDAIVFTGGVGENDELTRLLATKDLQFLGIEIDEAKNKLRSKEIRAINRDEASVKILVIPTNEELEIANQCFSLMHASQ